MSDGGLRDQEADEPSGTKRPNPVDVHVGNKVKLRRVLIGMSQERLGELLKLTFQQVQKYEKGTNRISASRLWRLAEVMGVEVAYFYEGLRYDTGGTTPTGFAEGDEETPILEFLNSREGLELNRAFQRITDPNVRRSVVELVRSLAGEPAKG